MKKQHRTKDSYVYYKSEPDVNLYVLKHKDLDVAMLRMDSLTGAIDYVLDVFLPEELPLGCKGDGSGLEKWWLQRAIPDTRRGIRQALDCLGEKTSQSLMLSAFGLSLTDHYWMQPIDRELYWKDINFYENVFSDELGNLLSDSGKIDADGHISKFSPCSSVNGEMKKKWIIKDGKRYLMKVNINDYGQQSVNEVIATRLHEILGWKNYVPYSMDVVRIDGREYPCSLNPLFTSEYREFVPAYQLISNFKIPNDVSQYEAIIQQAVVYGMDERDVRTQLEYTILTDFILSNTDRHYNNFGFLYDSKSHRLCAMAPVFDTGNALFYNQDIIPASGDILDIKVNSFCKREVNLLAYVRQPDMVAVPRLKQFPDEAAAMLLKYTDMPKERGERIGRTIARKIEYLSLFMQGKKIWKKEQYW